MSDDRFKREIMFIEEATISNMWEIAEAQKLASRFQAQQFKGY